MQFYLDSEIKKNFPRAEIHFDDIMRLRGEVVRELERRCTQRIELNGNYFFIKQHFGVGWKEIFKNLFQLRLPVLSAKNEFLAIQKLHQLNIATQEIVGYGCRGINPATQKSFLITRELPSHISLEDFCKPWKVKPPLFRSKKALISRVAHIARTLHENGINHRDFYICHFLLDAKNQTTLYLIDLHRAQIRKKTPERWLIKDLAGLYFSSKDIGLTSRDIVRFIKIYRNKNLREIFSKFNNKEAVFWQKVKTRGDKLYQQHEK